MEYVTTRLSGYNCDEDTHFLTSHIQTEILFGKNLTVEFSDVTMSIDKNL
jgi:hypothetical protein